MILKQLRLSRNLSQDQLAQMSGLNVRTIQRIESGARASVESLKCLAAALEVDMSTLTEESFVIDKHVHNPKELSFGQKVWLFLMFLTIRPKRQPMRRIELLCHVTGFAFCVLGLFNEPARFGGVIMLATAYMLHFLTRHGDKRGIWYDDAPEAA